MASVHEGPWKSTGVLRIHEPGSSPGRLVALAGRELVLGRDACCDVVLGPRTVSRRHARLVRRRDGSGYDLEDLRSTGGTWINGRLVDAPVLLSDGDRIRLGDCILEYRASAPSPEPTESCEATILGVREVSATEEHELVEIRAEEKLRAILEIGRELAGIRNLDGTLDRILGSLFRIFPQAQRGMVLLRQGQGDPELRAFRTRGQGEVIRPTTHGGVRFSRTVLEHVIGRGQAVLCSDITDDARFAESHSVDDMAFRTMMCVPLFDHQRQAMGMLQLDTNLTHGVFRQEDLDLLVAVAGPVSVGVDNARLLDDSRQAREDALAASRAKDRFLAILSHELRTPLTPALLASTSLLEDHPPPPLRPTLEMIRRNVQLEAHLIDDLLDLTRIARGRMTLDLQRVDAHELIRQAVGICWDEIHKAGLTLKLDLAAETDPVEADPTRFQQVVWNLIQNAVKFTPPGGTVFLGSHHTRAPDGSTWLVVEVHDTGVGIDPMTLGRIFEPFEQGEPEPGFRARGLGLGLTISRALAEAHGGRLTAASDGQGHGATFALELPLPAVAEPSTYDPVPDSTMPDVPIPKEFREISEPATLTEPIRQSPLRILLVEDNRDTLRSLAMVLRARGHQIGEAENLAAARAALAQDPFDLVISDIELPDGSGLDLMRTLRRGGSIPGIAMSGFGTEDDIRASLAAGFARHLIKPVMASQLAEAIAKVVARARNGAHGA